MLQRVLVGARVVDEQQAARLHEGIVFAGLLDEAFADLRCDLYEDGPYVGIVGSRMTINLINGQQKDECCSRDNPDEDTAAEPFAIMALRVLIHTMSLTGEDQP